MEKTQKECCPQFDPEPWNNKEFEWDNKMFIKDSVCTFMYMPMNIGKVMRRTSALMEKAGAKSPQWLALSDHTSKWNMDMYIEVDREVPGAENVKISGKFLSKVYDGDYRETGNWCKDFESVAKSKNYSVNKWYMWYVYCPKCAKKYGHNYVAIIGKVN